MPKLFGFQFRKIFDYDHLALLMESGLIYQRPRYTRTGFQFIIRPISDVFDNIEYFFCIIQMIQL